MMSTTKRLIVAGMLALGLAGCSGGPSAEAATNTDVSGIVVPLPDGGSVTCVVYEGYKAGGITCDWGVHDDE